MTNMLVPVRVADKNGKIVKRWVNPDKARDIMSQRKRGLLATPPPPARLSSPVSTVVGEERDPILYKNLEPVTSPDGGIWAVAPEGLSARVCSKCSALQKHQVATDLSPSNCELCGERIYPGTVIKRVIREDQLPFFDDSAVRNQTWLHVSTHQKWGSNITRNSNPYKQPFVHIGTMDSVLDRKAHVIDERGRNPKFYLYSVRLRDDAEIAPRILVDIDHLAPNSPEQADDRLRSEQAMGNRRIGTWEEHVSYADYSRTGVTRYVNNYEAPGTISLLAHPSAFEIVDRQDF